MTTPEARGSLTTEHWRMPTQSLLCLQEGSQCEVRAGLHGMRDRPVTLSRCIPDFLLQPLTPAPTLSHDALGKVSDPNSSCCPQTGQITLLS